MSDVSDDEIDDQMHEEDEEDDAIDIDAEADEAIAGMHDNEDTIR